MLHLFLPLHPLHFQHGGLVLRPQCRQLRPSTDQRYRGGLHWHHHTAGCRWRKYFTFGQKIFHHQLFIVKAGLGDYIEIANLQPGTGTSTTINPAANRMCGVIFNAAPAPQTAQATACSFAAPFKVGVHFDDEVMMRGREGSRVLFWRCNCQLQKRGREPFSFGCEN